jgi:ubiquitin-protein ligase
MMGPDDTEWEGGIFNLRIEFHEEYPVKPPKVVFVYPKMFHPNIYVNGEICLDILQKNWTQAYNIMAVMKSIQQLLIDPNTASPANAAAARLFDSDKAEYYR